VIGKAGIARFEEAVMPHLDAAYNLARWLTRNDSDAEDVVQEALLRAVRFFDGARDPNLRAWFLTIVRHTAFTWLRRNRPAEIATSLDATPSGSADTDTAPGVVPLFATPTPDPEALLMQLRDRRMIDRLIEQLPPEFREVLVLRELEELSYRDIASVTGAPIGTVMSRLARARGLLRKAWLRTVPEEERGHGV
jgi:RNA polymerase sigma-70 factor (ECF subfamily)